MFRPTRPQVSFPKLEEEILAFWKEHDIPRKQTEQREGRPRFVLYEGPPTANGRPGVHHVLSRVFKDIFPRYRAMRGYQVVRRAGWDTHGLPVELEIEKKLGFKTKHDIEAYGVAEFNRLCRESVFAYIKDWEELTERIAFWVDLSDPYITYTNAYIESIWWILKNFWDRGLLYRDYKVVPYCPRCGTPLADHEVALGYEEVDDPSVYVRLVLEDQPDTALLVWTTTPWTLPGNVAVAAHPDYTYVKVARAREDGSTEYLILAEERLAAVFPKEDLEVVERYTGKDLAGWRYRPLYTFLPTEGKRAYEVVLGEFVTLEEGTGLVHMAPAFGAEDMEMARRYDLPVLLTVDEDGRFIDAVKPWAGMWVKDADKHIIRDLRERGLLLKAETYRHNYPHCWRCKTPLLYYARRSWFIATSRFKDKLLEANERIRWIPAHIKHGRFGNWLENNIDWALSRFRYWGTPLPIWRCDHCGHEECMGSLADLEARVGHPLKDLDLHRPYVDEVTYPCPACRQGTMRRYPEVIDVWFDSGAMPVAQWHFPYENRDAFWSTFPADYICEGVDQTRGWFYSLHAISTLLFGRECYKNVISLGLILDEKGEKMSKSKGNVVDPWSVINVHGVDALRWYLFTAAPPGDNRRFSVDLVGSAVREFLLLLWNVYHFFVTYANLDGWTPDPNRPKTYTVLDRWLRSELHTLVKEVTAALEDYDAVRATRPIQRFVDRLSRWYVRLNRRRFWKGENDADKEAAYATLYEALVTLAYLLAPSTPFVAEALYQNLVRSVDPNAPLSVHLADWPEADEAAIDETLNREMDLVIRLTSLGRAAREKHNIRLRQPLKEALVAIGRVWERDAVRPYLELMAQELNVKTIRLLDFPDVIGEYVIHPLPKQLGQKYKALFPKIRQAILSLDPKEVAHRVLAGEAFAVEVEGQTYTIQPDEVEVRLEPRTGYAVAMEGPYVVALDTALTPELQREGWVREFVHRVQNLRKDAGLELTDRIRVYVHAASPEVREALEGHRTFILNEVLGTDMVEGVPDGVPSVSFTLDGEQVTVGLEKV